MRKIDNVSEQVIEKTDYNLRKKLESIDTNHFKIDIPSALSMIIRSCLKSKQTIDKFLDSTIELRNSKKIENFRKWLAELELAFNTDIKKYKRMKKKASNLLEEKVRELLDEAGNTTTLTIAPSGPSITNIPIGKLVNLPAISSRSE